MIDLPDAAADVNVEMMRAQAGNAEKIVVVDDTVEILELLTLVLSEEGFQVICCPDASQALDTVAAERPSLVIVDLTMAGVRSWDLVDALAADPRTGHTPFIVCSGAVQELHAAESRVRALGGDVLGKPFDIDRLIDKVQRLIAGDDPV